MEGGAETIEGGAETIEAAPVKKRLNSRGAEDKSHLKNIMFQPERRQTWKEVLSHGDIYDELRSQRLWNTKQQELQM